MKVLMSILIIILFLSCGKSTVEIDPSEHVVIHEFDLGEIENLAITYCENKFKDVPNSQEKEDLIQTCISESSIGLIIDSLNKGTTDA